ncbi:MmgE/PrpD family protein [Blastococcus tunisiensis]|uniref:2-methylcitrate dehydratase PrpD n=1 Tax=Blastococcus tunisiensis TaxID=1798228 RepID=A0A1I1ZQU1_9ACTN|nr:MmgE/PrpD family protein [Blastococcus sp. DSM 46838]SFE33962.1 2-methylcitrate dehydratase PrpD [Blastococcus sp. DSM 46838]
MDTLAAPEDVRSATGVAAGGLTRHLADAARASRFEDLPGPVVRVAKHCMLDWLGVALAGAREPAARLLRDELVEPGSSGPCTLLDGSTGGAREAALVNGTAGHALDFDDVVWVMTGHPTAPLLPAVLAVGELVDASGRDLLTAFVAGFETESRIGAAVAPGHYDAGFHATATLGTLGAAAGCARLLDLDEDQWQHAFGIAATSAAGLKSMFGSMCKPMHAGNAASQGVLAARLAARGFTAATDAIERPQGFGPTHTATFHPEAGQTPFGDPWYVREVLFKFHAACFLTHSAIEGLLRLKEAEGLAADDVDAVLLRVEPGHLAVCNIPEPRSGLEAKFSLRFTAAMAVLTGRTDEAAFTDDVVRDPRFTTLRDRVTVVPEPGRPAHETDVQVRTRDGRTLRTRVDMQQWAADDEIDAQERRLVAKFRSLVGTGDAAERLLEAVLRVDELSSVRELTRLVADVARAANGAEGGPA